MSLTTAVPAAERSRSAFHFARLSVWLEQILLGVAAIFYALHFVHLRADFPNHSMWMDWAKYTDEGWYGDAAIRHYLWGHWNVPGDFNPAAALPVWPLLEGILFRFTGVSLVAARVLAVCVFGGILAASYYLVRRWSRTMGAGGRPSLAPALAVLLLATSHFCFVFTRMAILEPLLILLTLCALIVADASGPGFSNSYRQPRWATSRPMLPAIALGCLLPIIVLTKTTGVFLFPAIFFMLWAAAGGRRTLFLRNAFTSSSMALGLWGSYYLFFVRRHYLADYHYLFSANTYTKITIATFWSVLDETITDGVWIGATLFWVSFSAALGWLAYGAAKRFRVAAVPAALALWVFGYGAFLAYHANFAPRYYTVIAVPLMLLLAISFDAITGAAERLTRGNGGATRATGWVVAFACTIAICFIVGRGARQTLRFALHPQYTFLTAVHHLNDEIRRQVSADPHHSRLLLSISGSDISLITGLPSICDDFGVMELPDRVAAYKPGWFAAWNDVEDDKMAALAPMYRVVRVGEYPAYDDPERNLLILYRLDPLSSPRRGRSGRRRYFVDPHRRRGRSRAAQQAGQ